jgi:tRNA U34 2-thiouridine synthase MnmA/TrmU
VRTRYRAELLPIGSLRQLKDGNWHLVLQDEVRALTPGQSAFIYQAGRVVGAGIVR